MLLITRKQLLGEIAKEAVYAAPFDLPFDFQETLKKIDSAFIATPTFLMMDDESGRQVVDFECYDRLYAYLKNTLSGVTEFLKWNLTVEEYIDGVEPLSQNRKFVSRFSDRNMAIDLDQLITNVCISCVTNKKKR